MQATRWTWKLALLVAALLVGSCGGSDAQVDDATAALEDELHRRVVPELQDDPNSEAVWEAFQDALVATRQTGAHVTRGTRSRVSDIDDQVRLTTVLAVIGDNHSICLAVSVRSTGEVDTMPVSGTSGRNCADATALPF